MGNSENENVLNTNCISKPGYKYVEVVRGKDERAKLNGYKCRDCQQVFFSELLHFRPPKISPMKVEISLFPPFRHPPPPPPAPNTANKEIRCRVFSSDFPPLCSVPLFLSCSLSILSTPAFLYPLPPSKKQRNERKKCVTPHIELIEALFLLLVIAIASTIRPQDLYIFKGPSHPNFFPPGSGHRVPLFLGDPPVHPSS